MKPTQISLSMSTTYLLRCLGGYLQIDTGYDKDCPACRNGLKKLGIELGDLKHLVLTHPHEDHAGSRNHIPRDASLTIIAHEQSRTLLQTGKNDKTRGGGYVNSFVKWIADIKMRPDPTWTLTFPWANAHIFYRHRQRRWKQLLAK